MRRAAFAVRLPGLAAAALLLAACAAEERPEDDFGPVFEDDAARIAYVTVVEGSPSDRVSDKLIETLALYQREADGAPSLGMLRRRAEQDRDVALRVLHSYGYYAADIGIEVRPANPPPPPPVGRPTPSFPEALSPEPASPAREEIDPPISEVATARLVIDAGEAYTLREHRFVMVDVPPGPPLVAPDGAALGSPVGGQARGAGILAAEERALVELRAAGRPWARLEGRRAVADPAEATLEVESRIAPGPAAIYGAVAFEGVESISEEYLRSYQPWTEGETIDVGKLRDFQRELVETNMLDAASVVLPETPPEAEGEAPVVVPVTVRVDERLKRTVSLGARYDQELGASGRIGFERRNLFGEGETGNLLFTVGENELVGTAQFRKPQFLRPRQDFVSSLEGRWLDTSAYEETAVTGTAGVERELDDEWTVGIGGLLEYSNVDRGRREENVYLGGVPTFVAYDVSNDLLDPTEGMRWWFGATPFYGESDAASSPFLRLESRASFYEPLDDEADFVLALRARLGSILSEELEQVPPPRRLYSGGGTTVRGYDDRKIGPLDRDGDPIGGRSLLEGGAELRARMSPTFGLVGFVEGAKVSLDPIPDGEAGFRAAAGGGFRYYTPVGPIRFDLGFPLNPRSSDDDFEFYIGIGQAF